MQTSGTDIPRPLAYPGDADAAATAAAPAIPTEGAREANSALSSAMFERYHQSRRVTFASVVSRHFAPIKWEAPSVRCWDLTSCSKYAHIRAAAKWWSSRPVIRRIRCM